jgi:competence protein ComEA
MGQFYDEEKIKAMEAAAKAAPSSGTPAPAPTSASAPSDKPSGGHFYDENKIKEMEGAAGGRQVKANSFGFYALVALLVIAFAGMLWWKATHNPDTMIVNINKASAAEISYLPGIGPAKAKVIIDHRPYHSIEDLKKVPGIGEKTFEKMKARVKVE